MANNFNPDEYLADFNPDEYLSEEPIQAVEMQNIAIPTAGGLTGYALGKAAQKTTEVLAPKAREAAEELAFSRLGGVQTKTGSQLFGKELRDLYESSITSPKEVGRRVLDEDLLGTLGLRSSKSIQESATEQFQKALGEQTEFLKRPEISSKKIPLEQVYDEYRRLLSEKAVKGTEQGEAALKYLSKDLKQIETPENLLVDPELAEKMKRLETPELNIMKKGKISGKNLAKEAKRLALKESVEGAVEKAGLESGEDLLSQFQTLKKASGEAGLIKDIATEQLERQAKDSGPIKSLVIDSLLSRLKGTGAKALDVGADLAQKGAKALPFIGGGIGAVTAYGAARAEGDEPGTAAKKAAVEAAKEEALGLLEPLVASEPLGPKKTDISYKLERGEALTPEEQTSLQDQQRRMSELLNKYTTTKNEKLSDVYEKDINKYMSGTDRDKAAAQYKLLQNPYIRQKLKLDEQK